MAGAAGGRVGGIPLPKREREREIFHGSSWSPSKPQAHSPDTGSCSRRPSQRRRTGRRSQRPNRWDSNLPDTNTSRCRPTTSPARPDSWQHNQQSSNLPDTNTTSCRPTPTATAYSRAGHHNQPHGQAGRSGKEVAGTPTLLTQIPTVEHSRGGPAGARRAGAASPHTRTAAADGSHATAAATKANGNSSSTTRHPQTDNHRHRGGRPRGGHGRGTTNRAWGVADAAETGTQAASNQQAHPSHAPQADEELHEECPAEGTCRGPQQNNEDGWGKHEGQGDQRRGNKYHKSLIRAEFRRLGLRKPAGSTWNQVAHIVGMAAYADQEDPQHKRGQRHEEDRARFRAMPWRQGPAASSSHGLPPHDPPQQSDASATAAAATATPHRPDREASASTSTSSQQGTTPPTSGASSSGDSHRPMPLDSPISWVSGVQLPEEDPHAPRGHRPRLWRKACARERASFSPRTNTKGKQQYTSGPNTCGREPRKGGTTTPTPGGQPAAANNHR